MAVDVVLAGGGEQLLVTYATGPDGQPIHVDAATVRIVDLERHEDDGDREVLASSAAIIDEATAETTAKAGPRATDVRRIELDEIPEGLVLGRRYLIAAGGKREAFVLEAIDTDASTLWARDGLRNEYASGASVVGLALAVQFPGDVADDPDELDCRRMFGIDWTASAATPSRWRTIARIERRGRAPRALVDDLVRIDPQLAAITSRRTTLHQALAQAEIELDAALQVRGIDPLHFDTGLAGQLAISWRAAELSYRAIGNPDNFARADVCAAEACRWREALRIGRPPIDTTETYPSSDARRSSPRRSPFKVA
jgi:hypothetical protein